MSYTPSALLDDVIACFKFIKIYANWPSKKQKMINRCDQLSAELNALPEGGAQHERITNQLTRLIQRIESNVFVECENNLRSLISGLHSRLLPENFQHLHIILFSFLDCLNSEYTHTLVKLLNELLGSENGLDIIDQADLIVLVRECDSALFALSSLFVSIEHQGLSEQYAHQLMRTFPSIGDVLKYLKQVKRRVGEAHFSLESAMQYQLPDEDYSVDLWRQLAVKFHKAPVFFEEILPNASVIEKWMSHRDMQMTQVQMNDFSVMLQEARKLNRLVQRAQKTRHRDEVTRDERQQLLEKKHEARKNIAEFGVPLDARVSLLTLQCVLEQLMLLKQLTFDYFVRHGLSRKEHDVFLALKRCGHDSHIPPITLDGATLGQPGYYLIKVPVMDTMHAARACCFGKLLLNCAHLSGTGHDCIVHGLTKPNSGFYVVCEGDVNDPHITDKLEAAAWVWRNTDDAIVIDFIGGFKASLVQVFFHHLSVEWVTRAHTHKVFTGREYITKGIGVRTPFYHPYVLLQDYSGYSDVAGQEGLLALYDVKEPYKFAHFSEQAMRIFKDWFDRNLDGDPDQAYLVSQRVIAWGIIHGKNTLVAFVLERYEGQLLRDSADKITSVVAAFKKDRPEELERALLEDGGIDWSEFNDSEAAVIHIFKYPDEAVICSQGEFRLSTTISVQQQQTLFDPTRLSFFLSRNYPTIYSKLKQWPHLFGKQQLLPASSERAESSQAALFSRGQGALASMPAASSVSKDAASPGLG